MSEAPTPKWTVDYVRGRVHQIQATDLSVAEEENARAELLQDLVRAIALGRYDSHPADLCAAALEDEL